MSASSAVKLTRNGIILALAAILLWLPAQGDAAALRDNAPEKAFETASANPYWYGFGSGNDVASNILLDGDYIWTGNGAGVVRWEKATGKYRMFLPWDGLTSSYILSILKDQDGHYWFGTNYGISEYDGRNWITHSPDTIGMTRPWRSLVDLNGNLWFGGQNGGLSMYDGAAWTQYNTTASGLVGRSISGLAVDSKGNILVVSFTSSDERLHSFDGTNWTTIPQAQIASCSDNLEHVAVAPNDDVWVTCETSLARRRAGAWTAYTSANGVDFNPNSIAFSADGTVYAGGYGGVYQLQDSGNFKAAATGFDVVGENSNLAVDNDGTIWAGSNTGLWLYDGTTKTNWMTVDHISSNNSNNITVDSLGNAWVLAGTVATSVSQLIGGAWVGHCPFDYGIPQNCQGGYDITTGASGDVWIAGKGLARFRNGGWTLFTPPDDDLSFYAVREPTPGVIYAATTEKLYTFDGDHTWSSVAVPGADLYPWTDMAVRGSEIWLVNYSHVFRWNGAAWTVFSQADGLPGVNFRGIAVSNSDVWVAGQSGLGHFEGSTWTTLTTDDGLPINQVIDIAYANDGTLWAAFGGYINLAYLDGSTWQKVPGIYQAGKQVDDLFFAPDGNLWINNRHMGIQVYNQQGAARSFHLPDSGGSAISIDGKMKANFDQDVFDGAVTVTCRLAQRAVQDGLKGVGVAYSIEAVSDETQQTVQPGSGDTYELTIHYNPSGLSQGEEQSLALYWWDGKSWVLDDSSQLNLAAQTVTARPNHLGLWAVMPLNTFYLPLVSK